MVIPTPRKPNFDDLGGLGEAMIMRMKTKRNLFMSPDVEEGVACPNERGGGSG